MGEEKDIAVISFDKKFIFIKTRKTAGTSIQKSLLDFCEKDDIVTLGWKNIINNKKCKVSEFCLLRDIEKNFNIEGDDYFKFGFTRNPYSIVLSRYLFNIKRKRIMGPPDRVGFNNWIKNSYRFEREGSKHDIIPLDRSRILLFDNSRSPVVDFIGKFETLKEDFNEVVKKIGLKDVKLPWINKSNIDKIKYKEWLDTDSKKLIRRFFDFEFEYFKYVK